MKKALAVLLAVMMAFSVCVVCVSAEDDGETTTGTTYTWSKDPGLGRINAKSNDDAMEVVILQAGDKIEFEEVTAKTTETKYRTIEVIYYPDAASIKDINVKNVYWKDTMVPKYNLSSENWTLDEGQNAADLLAKSPSHYKTFYTTGNFWKGDIAGATIVGLNELAHARDSAGIDRGSEDGEPIDFALPGAKFLGWALYSYGSWKASGTGTVRVELYALWERGAAEEKPTEPTEPENPEYATPVQKAAAKVLGKLAEIFDWLKVVNGLPAAVAKILNDKVLPWLYDVFGIEA